MRFRFEIFHPGASAAASARRKAGERDEERGRESRELNYFVELEGEKVIDKVVPLHPAPSLPPSPACSAVCARRGRSSVRFGATATLGAKKEEEGGRTERESSVPASPPLPTSVWVADYLESFGSN